MTHPHASCHPMIKSVAREMAAEAYEELVRQNRINLLMKIQGMTQDRFVNLNWSRHIEGARQILAGMLASTAYDTTTKDSIADALIKDGSLHVGRPKIDANGVVS